MNERGRETEKEWVVSNTLPQEKHTYIISTCDIHPHPPNIFGVPVCFLFPRPWRISRSRVEELCLRCSLIERWCFTPSKPKPSGLYICRQLIFCFLDVHSPLILWTYCGSFILASTKGTGRRHQYFCRFDWGWGEGLDWAYGRVPPKKQADDGGSRVP